MDSSLSSEAIIDLLAQNEERIRKLYEAYAEKFPDYRVFWNDLAGEEAEHAAWIRKLASKAKEGTIIVNKGRFNTAAISTFSNYVDKELTNLKTSSVSLIGALSVALYLEESIIEHNYFEVFEGDSLIVPFVITKFNWCPVGVQDHTNHRMLADPGSFVAGQLNSFLLRLHPPAPDFHELFLWYGRDRLVENGDKLRPLLADAVP